MTLRKAKKKTSSCLKQASKCNSEITTIKRRSDVRATTAKPERKEKKTVEIKLLTAFIYLIRSFQFQS